MRPFVLIFTFFVGLFMSPASVTACSCAGSGLPCEAFWNASAVFSGEVQEVIVITPESVMPDGTRSYGPISKKIHLSVIEKFSGFGKEKLVEINTGGGGGDCGYNFQKGLKYLVYAYKNPQTGALSTGICTRTQLLEKAAEDVNYFKSLKTAKPGARIFGSVFQTFARRNDSPYINPKPLAGISVSIDGGGKFETQTGEDGGYEFKGLPAGEYKIGIETPEKLWGYEQSQTVKVRDKGCAGYSFFLQNKTVLSGKLLNEKSEPAAKISVDLIPVEQVNNSRQSDRQFAYTDDEGKFIFRSIPAGKYYLGIRLSGLSDTLFPYPQTFYPGTLNLNEAKVISIEEGQILENYDFKLLQKLSTRRISGTIVFPDGTPAANAYISVNETEYFYSFSFRGVGDSKPDGTFSFELIDGIRYLVKPYVSLKGGGQSHAEPIEIPASGDVTNLKFIITEPNGNCEKCMRWKRNK